MHRTLRPTALVPPGLLVERVSVDADRVVLTARAGTPSARCPSCDRSSTRLHSRYPRTLSDLPAGGRRVVIRAVVRRFRCVEAGCRTRIFAERLGDGLAHHRARRTSRLDSVLHHLGLALGGRPAAGVARRLMLPASRDTLLRVVRRRARRLTERPTVIGVDDWAYKRGQRYGTIICDLERRRVVTLLPDREASTIESWLSVHPEISIIARDRGGGYGEAAARAWPKAIQVADRCEVQLWADASGRTMVVPHVPMRTEVIEQRVVLAADRTLLRLEPITPIEERADSVTVPAATDPARAATRETNRAFWDAFIADARFDHPDQGAPRHGGNNWVRLDLPAPATSLTIYRSGSTLGLFATLAGSAGAALFGNLAVSLHALRAESQLDLTLSTSASDPFKGAIGVKREADEGAGLSDQEARAWLIDGANRMINLLRPRLAQKANASPLP